jgi:ABC-2 type transport system permease protein
MPIHDQGYRRYGGSKAAVGQGWLVIARAGIRTMLARRVLQLLLLAGWTPFFGRAIQIYAQLYVQNLSQSPLLAITAETFHDMVDSTVNFVVFLITVYVGAGLIANDRRANALQIYLSKPLSRTEYVFGKLTILMTFLLLVTWVPAMVLLLVQMAFAGNFTFLGRNLFLFPAITVFSFLDVITVSVTMLALSALSNSSRYVGIMYTAVIFFSAAVYGVLFLSTRSTALSWVSFSANLTQVGDLIFRLPPKYDTPWPLSLGAIIAVIVIAGVVLERRVRGVEVVA